MRIYSILATLALLTASPTPAQVTARYASAFGPGMTVQVDERGRSRISMGNQMAVIHRDGIDYVVMGDLSGIFAVRQEDMIEALAQQARLFAPERSQTESAADTQQRGERQAPQAAPDPIPLPPGFSAPRANGMETVGGRTGTVWTLAPPGEDNSLAGDFVVSDDPALAPIGRVIARQYGASAGALSRMVPGTSGLEGRSFSDLYGPIFARGTIIRFGRQMRLESVDIGPVPASAFELPTEVLTRERFVARMGWNPAQAR
jgi:hypothetical protein